MQQVFDTFLENYYPANVLSKETYYRMFANNKEQVSDLESREDQSVFETPYLPEIERYGGIEVMEYSENIFCCSSIYALKLLSLMGNDTKRSIYAALDMMLCCLEEVNSGKGFLSYYIKFWNEFTGEVPKEPSIAVNIASAYQDRYLKMKNNEIDFYREWRECIKINKKEIMEKQTSYSSSEAAWSMIMASQIHITNNRLGITPNYESTLAQTLLILMRGDETVGV